MLHYILLYTCIASITVVLHVYILFPYMPHINSRQYNILTIAATNRSLESNVSSHYQVCWTIVYNVHEMLY